MTHYRVFFEGGAGAGWAPAQHSPDLGAPYRACLPYRLPRPLHAACLPLRSTWHAGLASHGVGSRTISLLSRDVSTHNAGTVLAWAGCLLFLCVTCRSQHHSAYLPRLCATHLPSLLPRRGGRAALFVAAFARYFLAHAAHSPTVTPSRMACHLRWPAYHFIADAHHALVPNRRTSPHLRMVRCGGRSCAWNSDVVTRPSVE